MAILKNRIKRIILHVIPYWMVSALARLARGYIRYSPFFLGKETLCAFPVFNWFRIHGSAKTRTGEKYFFTFPDSIQKSLFFFGYWEPSITNYICHTLSEGHTFIDIGANIGYYTCLASKLVGCNGKVYAIEASPSIYRALQNNIRLNGMSNIRTYNVAITDIEKTIGVFMAHDYNIGETTTSPTIAQSRGFQKETQISAFPLPKLIEHDELVRARLIKIDVEGAEWEVIQGMADMLQEFCSETEWLMELKPGPTSDQAAKAKEIMRLFSEAGFQAYQLENQYSLSWYIREGRHYLTCALPELLKRPLRSIDAQVDVLFTRRSLPSISSV